MNLLPLLLTTALAGPPPPACVAPQEPPAPEKGEEAGQEPPPKQEFEKLSGSARKKAKKALALLKGGRTDEARAGAEQELRELGEGVVPLLLEEWGELEAAERGVELRRLVDALLADDALHLAWPAPADEAEWPLAERRYLLRRWADCGRKDAAEFLRARLKGADGALAYEAARGLALRGDASGFDALAAWIAAAWTAEAAALRADFADVERGPMSAKAAQMANAQKRKDQLTGLHLFELFGVREHAAMLLPALSESDTSLRLAAIDACRAVIDGDGPLERPSMTEIIERAEKWKQRIDALQKERVGGGAR